MEKDKYTLINADTIDSWVNEGWEWGQPISHEMYVSAQHGKWDIVMTPTIPVPHEWFSPFIKNGRLKGIRILGLASGGGQQMPIMAALGAICTVFDISTKQLESEKLVADREGYHIEIVQGDMTNKFPFEDETFDIILHPVSNCYVEKVEPIFKEAYRVLKKGGILIGGYDNSINYLFTETSGPTIVNKLPFNPLKDKALYEQSIKNNDGIQFSHTLDEQLGGQCKAGFVITDIYEDYDDRPSPWKWLADYGIATFYAVRALKLPK